MSFDASRWATAMRRRAPSSTARWTVHQSASVGTIRRAKSRNLVSTSRSEVRISEACSRSAESPCQRLGVRTGQLERLGATGAVVQPRHQQGREQRHGGDREQVGFVLGRVAEREPRLREEMQGVQHGHRDAHDRRGRPARVRGVDDRQDQEGKRRGDGNAVTAEHVEEDGRRQGEQGPPNRRGHRGPVGRSAGAQQPLQNTAWRGAQRSAALGHGSVHAASRLGLRRSGDHPNLDTRQRRCCDVPPHPSCRLLRKTICYLDPTASHASPSPGAAGNRAAPAHPRRSERNTIHDRAASDPYAGRRGRPGARRHAGSSRRAGPGHDRRHPRHRHRLERRTPRGGHGDLAERRDQCGARADNQRERRVRRDAAPSGYL